jgi:lipopolysaccharide export system protein LptA
LRITVNGTTFDVPDGSSVSVINGQVVVGGRTMSSVPPAAPVYITVDGTCGSIQTQSGDVTVTGDVNGSVSTMSGGVSCGKVGGSVSTMSGRIVQAG